MPFVTAWWSRPVRWGPDLPPPALADPPGAARRPGAPPRRGAPDRRGGSGAGPSGGALPGDVPRSGRHRSGDSAARRERGPQEAQRHRWSGHRTSRRGGAWRHPSAPAGPGGGARGPSEEYGKWGMRSRDRAGIIRPPALPGPRAAAHVSGGSSFPPGGDPPVPFSLVPRPSAGRRGPEPPSPRGTRNPPGSPPGTSRRPPGQSARGRRG